MSVIPPQTEPWFWEKQLNKRCLPRRQNATRPPQSARIMGDRLVKEKSGIFFFKSFWRPCGATAHLRGATRRRPIPKAAKFWWDSKLPLWSLCLEYVHIFHSFNFYFLTKAKVFLTFWPRQMALWEKQRLESLRSCFSLFGELEYSKNGVSLIPSFQVLSSLHFWIIKFILHIEIFRPTRLFKNFYTRTLRYWWLMLMLQFAFF